MLSIDIVFLVRMLAATFHSPRGWVEVSSLRQPILANVLGTRRNPRKSLARTTRLMTWHTNALSWQPRTPSVQNQLKGLTAAL